tara:strand:+ start:282 stop:539 length:258 start_codon:yes stop_codon:yes gene_type:complete
MVTRKNIWDSLDKLEGKKDSSHANLQTELKRQGYKKNHFTAGAKSNALKSKTEVKKYSAERKAHTKKTGWEESGTGSRYIPEAYR